MLYIGVILGSTSPGLLGKAVADWVLELAKQRKDAEFELVDIKDFDRPKKWAKTISALDGFIFVTPEYNHSTSAALKNALDYLYSEWNNKVAGFVGYGVSGGASTVEQLRTMMGKLQITDVRAQVTLKVNEIEEYDKFIPASPHKQILYEMIDQIIYWGEAMKKVRSKSELA